MKTAVLLILAAAAAAVFCVALTDDLRNKEIGKSAAETKLTKQIPEKETKGGKALPPLSPARNEARAAHDVSAEAIQDKQDPEDLDKADLMRHGFSAEKAEEILKKQKEIQQLDHEIKIGLHTEEFIKTLLGNYPEDEQEKAAQGLTKYCRERPGDAASFAVLSNALLSNPSEKVRINACSLAELPGEEAFSVFLQALRCDASNANRATFLKKASRYLQQGADVIFWLEANSRPTEYVDGVSPKGISGAQAAAIFEKRKTVLVQALEQMLAAGCDLKEEITRLLSVDATRITSK